MASLQHDGCGRQRAIEGKGKAGGKSKGREKRQVIHSQCSEVLRCTSAWSRVQAGRGRQQEMLQLSETPLTQFPPSEVENPGKVLDFEKDIQKLRNKSRFLKTIESVVVVSKKKVWGRNKCMRNLTKSLKDPVRLTVGGPGSRVNLGCSEISS